METFRLITPNLPAASHSRFHPVLLCFCDAWKFSSRARLRVRVSYEHLVARARSDRIGGANSMRNTSPSLGSAHWENDPMKNAANKTKRESATRYEKQ